MVYISWKKQPICPRSSLGAISLLYIGHDNGRGAETQTSDDSGDVEYGQGVRVDCLNHGPNTKDRGAEHQTLAPSDTGA